MKIRFYKPIFSLFIVFAVTLSSCVGDLDVTPIDPSVTQDFDQEGVFAKIYASMALTGQEGPSGRGDVSGIDEGTSAFYRLIFTINEYPTDELICSWGDVGIPEMNYMRWNSTHGMIEGLYGRLYFGVTLSNHFLEMTEGLSDENTNRQRAEVRFMRALNYYYLVDIFGNVPFTEVVSTTAPTQIARADLYKYIETELLAVEGDMFEPMQAPYGRADKAAAWLLLSRLYLNAEVYTGTAQWSNAAIYAKKVMDSAYDLADNYKHLFMADNDESSTVNTARKEIILPIMQDGVRTISYGGSLFAIAATHTEGMTLWGTTEGWGGLRARRALVRKFFPNDNAPTANETVVAAAANDDRALFYTIDRTLQITNVNTFKEGYSVAKWTNVRADGKTTSHSIWTDTDIPFLRLGEAYLTYAEATLRSGESTGTGVALQTINDLRDRANASPLPSVTLNDILDERAREMYFEGHRRSDLIRYGYFTSSAYVWDWKGGIAGGTSVSSFYNLCPIPATDLTVNPNLKQNTGY